MALSCIKMFRCTHLIFTEIIHNSKNLPLRPICSRGHHVLISNLNLSLRRNENLTRATRSVPLAAVTSVRWSNGNSAAQKFIIDESTLPPIPTPPSVDAEGFTQVVMTVAESAAKVPTIADYGLGKWTPVGLVQNTLEFFHLSLDLPWWGAIVLGTVVLRMLVFPLVIVSQRNAAKMSNNLPQLQRIQQKMTEARQSGNNFEAARLSQDMMVFMKEKDMSPFKNILPPLAQAPLFISMFMGLRSMANVPVESLRTGGALWFMDLTVPDQYYLLPIITSLTLAATVELGTDSARASSLGMMRYVLRAVPVIIFPFTLNFPGAVLCYWVSTNFVSLLQVGILRIPKVRQYFKIEALVTHPVEVTKSKKGFVEGVKESMSNMKLSRELQDRQHIDTVNFQKAGRAPIQRTFKYDPTKVKPPTTSELLAKKKS